MRGLKLKQDVAINLIFAVIKAIALMWMIRLAGSVFLPIPLGIFLLTRRVSNTGANLFQLGMSQTLLRYISMHIDDAKIKRAYVLLADLVWWLVVVVSVPFLYVFRAPLALWLFPGVIGSESLTFWTGLLLLANVLDFITRSPLLAERNMILANVGELMNSSGFLLLALLWAGEKSTPIDILQFQTWTMLSCSLMLRLFYFVRLGRIYLPEVSEWRTIGKSFINYGLPRSTITFFDLGIFLIGPWVLRTQIDQSGFLIIALTLLQIFSVAIGPIAQVALVIAARFVGRKDETSIEEGVKLLFGSTIYATLLGMAVGLPWVKYFVQFWLSDRLVIAGMLPYSYILAWGFLPFVVFQGLKGIVDVRWIQPRNLYTLLVGGGAFLIVYNLLRPYLELGVVVSLALVAGFWALGAITLVWVRSYLRPISYLGWKRLALVSLILASVNFGFAYTPAIWKAGLSVSISLMIVSAFMFVFPTPFIYACLAFVRPLQKRSSW